MIRNEVDSVNWCFRTSFTGIKMMNGGFRHTTVIMRLLCIVLGY